MSISFDDYIRDVAPGLGFPPQRAYELNLNLIQGAVTNSALLKNLTRCLEEAAESYAPGKKELLLGSKISDPEILTKTYDSAIIKTYRENVIFNRNYPRPPTDSGWVNGANIYSRINDIVRARIVCKYMDGPEHICKALKALCDSQGIVSEYKAMSTDRGYYSWHYYSKINVEVLSGDNVQSFDVHFELQITTQLAEVLTALTHRLYESDRVLPRKRPDDEWKWQPETSRFRSAYLGHTLHLLEGVILNLKDDYVGGESNEQGKDQ